MDKKFALNMRKDCLYMALKAGKTGAHLGGTLSMIEIMAVLYGEIMKYDVKNPLWNERDRFILSKGHGVPAQYAAMHQVGLITTDELETFKSNDTFLTGHPSMCVERGIEFSSGSLGQGLSLGVGTGLALQRKNNDTSNVYVLLGDGECNEGSVWEAAASAAHYGLKHLIAIVDCNKLQYDGNTVDIMNMNDMVAKWEAFGWCVKSVDGHNENELIEAFQTKHSKPLVVIANTVKGKGISFMEGNPLWHHSVLSEKKYNQAMEELEANS